MKKVLIPTKLDTVAAEILKAHGGYNVVQDAKTPLEEQVKSHPDAYALIVRSEKVPAAIIDALPQLKVIVRAGAGYDTIDIKHARKKGVDVMNTPGANANGVAEEVIAMMLADARHIVQADITTRAGGWEKKNYMGREITGKTVGIVGLGNIGRLVAKRLRGFECRILGYDPLANSDRLRDLGIESATLEEIFSQCDYVTLHIPGGESTRGLVGAKLIGLMKKGATIINCARYGIVDEEALRAVKAEKGLRYLNDVYPKDEAGPKSMTDIADLMLPHLGANTQEANFVAAQRAAQELIDLDEKADMSCIVNRDIPDGLERAYCELAFNLASLVRQISGTQTPIRMIETSFYGDLAPFGKWLTVSILSGIWREFDRYNDYKAALKFLKEMGIELVNREADSEKGYGSAITIDLKVEQADKSLKSFSVRGTVTEGVQTVSRIDEFDRLYFEPSGATLFCLYDDRPGVIASISRKLADAGINIEDMRNPHNAKTRRSLAIIKLDQPISQDLLKVIKAEINAHSAICTVV
ncbi:MAG TPA: NAD(P)-dependent oxidoreductase [Kiritimatiellia bacterium]|nr:NAD(P)-dependent oxidoreductase [Kiritimatiellia bacterium]HRU70473.1 NAD(P)-dependent oxidoreductase [Kiritimatiellia bacterium]